MKPRITQKEVARAAGVSHATVSLALRDHASIPPATRERVQAVARKLGYVPDPMLAGLAAYRMSRRPAAYKSNIAWLDRFAPRPPGTDMIEYLKGASDRARELGYTVEVIRMTELGNSARRLEQILDAKGITGLMLPPCVTYGGELRIDYSRFSAVRLGYSYRYPVLHTIVNAQFKTAFGAFMKAVEAGYKRIGMILTRDTDLRTDWNFLGGFRAAQQSVCNAHRVEPLYMDGRSRGEIALWVKRHHIDAVIAPGYREHIEELNLGLGYAGLSLKENEKYVSGMHQNPIRIGIAAVEHLISMMHRGETGIPADPTFLCVPSRWIDGKTLPLRHSRRDRGRGI